MSFQNAKIIGENIPIEQYLAQPEGVKAGDKRFVMRSGELRAFFDCPQDWILNGNPEEEPEEETPEKATRSRLWGSIVDCLLTMPHELAQRYCLTPATYTNKKGETKPWTRRADSCKEWEDDKLAQGIEVVTPAMLEEAKVAAARLSNDPHIGLLVKGSKYQVMVTADFVEDDFIIPFKVLIDIVPPLDGKYGDSIANLKTAAKVGHDAWNRAVIEHGYDMQSALEFDLYNAAKPEENRTRYLHPIQLNKAPFTIGRRSTPPEMLDMGRAKYVRALRYYIRCLKTNTWPGIDDLSSDGWTDEVVKPWDLARL